MVTILSTTTCPFFPTLLVNLCYRSLSHPYQCLTDWGTEPCLCSMCLYSQRVKCSNDRPLSTQPTDISFYDRAMMKNVFQHVENCGSQGASIQQVTTRIISLNWPVTCSAGNWDRTNVGWGNMNSFYMSMNNGKHLTLRLLDLDDSPKCNNADIDWYMRMATNPPPVDPKLKHCLWYDSGINLPHKMISFHIELDMYICLNKSYTCLLARFSMQQASLERKGILYLLFYINKL